MVWPKPTEIAVLTVDGTQYSDWETVEVRHSLMQQPLFFCRFTCSEIAPFLDNWAALHIMPGAPCTVSLGGLLAFTGKVTTRQVFYDAKRHFIEIQAANGSDIASGSVVHQTMEFKDKTMEQIMREVLQPVGLNLVVEGGSLPTEKIEPPVRAMHGQKIFDFLDMVSRHGSKESGIGISFTSNVNGDFVVAVGPSGGTDQVTEGVNIIEGRETIYDPWYMKEIANIGQTPGTNKVWGAHAATIFEKTPFLQQGLSAVGGAGKVSGVLLSDLPSKGVMKGRTTSERNWMMEDLITVWATVQGWHRPSGGLWMRNQTVIVNSPMLVMDGVSLTAKVVRFTQDDRTGTRTNLELCNPQALANLSPQEQSK